MMGTQDIYEAWQQRIETDGLAKGQIRALFAVLDARGLVITPEQGERVRACRDLESLELWLRRAATVGHCNEVFAEFAL